MGVRKRQLKGKETAEYHYEFMQNGKRYYGVCEGCTTKAAALLYEKKMKETVKTLAEQKSVGALVENFKRELTGSVAIKIADAYELSLKKPRKRQPSPELIRAKRSYWQDFVDFMATVYPDIIALDSVTTTHAEAYIQQLRTNGRFNKTVSYSGTVIKKTREYQLKELLSPKTINTYQQTLSEVFKLLARDAGIVFNPFDAIPKLEKNAETREAFSEKELNLIRDNADDFILPLFVIAIATALREGDICTLKWSDIDFEKELIIRKMHKTGKYVEIPMIPPLKEYLLELQEKMEEAEDHSEYVLPEHARMYQQNSSGISYRIKHFLEQKCGIKTTKSPEGRSRSVSIKDLHSCRHTFCYYAGVYGIPLNVVQSIVGHMTPEMTKHYSAHASLEVKREKMKQLPAFMALRPSKRLPAANDETSTLRRKLKTALDRMDQKQLEVIEALLQELAKENLQTGGKA